MYVKTMLKLDRAIDKVVYDEVTPLPISTLQSFGLGAVKGALSVLPYLGAVVVLQSIYTIVTTRRK